MSDLIWAVKETKPFAIAWTIAVWGLVLTAWSASKLLSDAGALLAFAAGAAIFIHGARKLLQLMDEP